MGKSSNLMMRSFDRFRYFGFNLADCLTYTLRRQLNPHPLNDQSFLQNAAQRMNGGIAKAAPQKISGK
jgi:hypothetical protein